MRASGLALAVALALAGCANGPACDLVGAWMSSPSGGGFVGEKVAQTFEADGTYHIDLNSATFDGRWAVDGTTLTISDDGSCPAGIGDGVYTIRYAEGSCDDAVLALISDPCQGRMETLNGIHMIRPF